MHWSLCSLHVIAARKISSRSRCIREKMHTKIFTKYLLCEIKPFLRLFGFLDMGEMATTWTDRTWEAKNAWKFWLDTILGKDIIFLWLVPVTFYQRWTLKDSSGRCMGRIKEKMNNSNLPTHLPHNVTDTEMHSRDTNQDISKSSRKNYSYSWDWFLQKKVQMYCRDLQLPQTNLNKIY